MNTELSSNDARRMAIRLLPRDNHWVKIDIDAHASNGTLRVHIIVLFRQKDKSMRVITDASYYIQNTLDWHLYRNYLIHLGEALKNALDPDDQANNEL